jgi:hypothetical protein
MSPPGSLIVGLFIVWRPPHDERDCDRKTPMDIEGRQETVGLRNDTVAAH